MGKHQKLLASLGFAGCLLSAPALGSAQSFYFNGGTWTGLSGTASGTRSAYTVNNDTGGLSPNLVLTSPASGDNWNLYGTFTYTVLWTGTGTPPSDVDVQFGRQGCLTVAGNGTAEIESGSSPIYEMDSTNNFLSGAVASISTLDVISPLTLQPDGSYQSSGSLTSDTLVTDYNSAGGGVTSSQEYFTVISVTGTN